MYTVTVLGVYTLKGQRLFIQGGLKAVETMILKKKKMWEGYTWLELTARHGRITKSVAHLRQM